MQTTDFPHDNFAAEWNGKFQILEGGEYTFSITSDDGSKLTVEWELVVDSWSLHGMKEVKGTIKLVKGYHDIKVEMYQNGGGAGCIAKYDGPDTAGNNKLITGWHDPHAWNWL